MRFVQVNGNCETLDFYCYINKQKIIINNLVFHKADYAGYGSYRPMASTLDRLSTRSASAQQVNLANLRASTAISSSGHRTAVGNPRPSSVASNVRSSLAGQKAGGLGGAAANQRASNVRRMRNILDLESTRSIPTPTPTRNIDQRLLDINPAGKYCFFWPKYSSTFR